MAIKLIGLHGLARVGKDTFADYLCDNYNFVALSFATPLRGALLAMFSGLGLTPRHFEDATLKEAIFRPLGVSPRQLMQSLGTEWGRHLVCDDVWVKVLESKLEEAEFEGFSGVVVTDVRMPNEAANLVRRHGTLVHIRRRQAAKVNAHSSEDGLPVLTGDILVNNWSNKLETYYQDIEDKLTGLID